MIIQIPFVGFYYTNYNDDIDRAEEDFLEHYCEENDISVEVADKLRNSMLMFCDYGAMHQAIAKRYVEGFNDYMSEKVGFELGLTFSDMSSPKEYNFTTDRIFAFIDEDVVKVLLNHVGKDRLAKTLKKHFTSRDGFISFYSNQVEDYLDKPLDDWDYNELGILFHALWDDDDDFALYYRVSDDTYSIFDEGLDYAKFEQEVKELQLIESGECEDDGRNFPIGVTDPQVYVETYTKMNGLKP